MKNFSPYYLVTSVLTLFFMLSNFSLNAQCIETTVSTTDGETLVTTCPEDGNDDIIFFTPDIFATAYAYLVTDENDVILDIVVNGSFINFEGAPPGICRVWGMSYAGIITAEPGDNVATAQLTDFCYALSANFVEINRTGGFDINGGTVAMPSGATTRYTCPGDGNPDIVEFTNTGSTVASYNYVITDENFIILGFPSGNSQDFEGAGEGVCLVWGLSYTGTITALPGDNATMGVLTDGCSVLSDNFITIIRSNPNGGMVETTMGETEVFTCTQDGNPDIVEFVNNSTSDAPYAYVVTDENNIILGLPPGNSQDFDGAPEGICRVWGLSYTGNIIAQPGDDAAVVPITDDCFELSSNFIEVVRTGVEGGMVAMPSGATSRYVCVGDGNPDVVTFTNTSSANANYQYVITDENAIILGLPPGDMQDFEGAGTGVCLVWGLSYTGNITAMVGDDASAVPLSDECYTLSSNFIEVIRDMPDGGSVAMPSGETTRITCTEDGIPDLVTFTNNSASTLNYAYVITDNNNIILGLPSGDVQDFDGAPEGICRVWGLSHTGNIIAQPGDDVAVIPLTDDCFDLSDNFIEIIRTKPDGSTVETDNGEVVIEICVGDGEDDIINFTNSTTANANYQYVITDENNIILGLPPGNSQNFEGAGVGVCRVWGLSYTGNIIASVGDDAAAVTLTDDCYELSANFIEVIRTDDPAVCNGPSPSPFGLNEHGVTLSTQVYHPEVQLFPNPVSQSLSVKVDHQLENNSTILVRVFDASGKIVYRNNHSSRQIDLNVSNLPNGIFALQLTNGEFSKTKYFVKE